MSWHLELSDISTHKFPRALLRLHSCFMQCADYILSDLQLAFRQHEHDEERQWVGYNYCLFQVCLQGYQLTLGSIFSLTFGVSSLMCFGMLGSWLDTNNCYHSRAKYIIVNLERWHDVFVFVFTRGQFWPSGIVVACVCLCTCVCINHLFVRAITRDPLKLGSPNLDQRCKRLGYGPYCFGGKLTFTFKVKFNIKVRIYPILSLSAP